MIKSVYLDDKKYATFMPPFMVDDMKERGIIPDYIPNNEVSLHVCDGWHVLTDKECGITPKDKEQAKKEITEQKNKEFNIMMYDALHNDIYFH